MSVTPPSLIRRRESAARARRRRLVLLDVVLGALIGLFVLLLGFGLAPVGIIALLVLVGCGLSYGLGGRHRFRALAARLGAAREERRERPRRDRPRRDPREPRASRKAPPKPSDVGGDVAPIPPPQSFAGRHAQRRD